MASYIKREAARLSAQGQSITEIAKALTVTPSYIKQLEADEGFQAIKNAMEAATGISRHHLYNEIDDNYDELERLVSGAIVENVEELMLALSAKPNELVKFMTSVNSLKRRSTGEQHNDKGNEFQTIQLPAFMLSPEEDNLLEHVKHNSNNEIIEVAGTTLVSMNGPQLAKLAHNSKQESNPSMASLEAELTKSKTLAEKNTDKVIASNALADNLRKALVDLADDELDLR